MFTIKYEIEFFHTSTFSNISVTYFYCIVIATYSTYESPCFTLYRSVMFHVTNISDVIMYKSLIHTFENMDLAT